MSISGLSSARLERARGQYASCALCEHRCGVNRLRGERGFCNAGPVARVFRHRVECGEELELIPSHLFYLSGCDLRCAFCIAEENAFDPRRGVSLTGEYLAEAVAWGRARGARNVQWVGGEPTIHIPAIIEAVSSVSDFPPIVWKSDFYGSPEAFDLLEGFVDVYVADFKFGNDTCAHRIAGVDRYSEVVRRNLLRAGAASDLIVRQLLLPGHFDCCFVPIVHWLRECLPQVKFSIRDGYLPRWRANRLAELGTLMAVRDTAKSVALAEEYGLHVVR